MSKILASYRLVVLDSPVERWDDPGIRQLFGNAVSLRLKGYRRKYPPGVIPLGVSCWYATHLMVCEVGAELKPVMGFEHVTLQSYRRHLAPFAALSLCRETGNTRQIQAMEDLVSRFDDRPDMLSYTGGLTIDPALKADRDLVSELLNVMVALHYFLHQAAGPGHEIVTAPTTRFKVDSLLASYGFIPFLDAGPTRQDELLTCSSFAGEEVRLMRVQAFNRTMVEFAAKYRAWWDDRIVFPASSDLTWPPADPSAGELADAQARHRSSPTHQGPVIESNSA